MLSLAQLAFDEASQQLVVQQGLIEVRPAAQAVADRVEDREHQQEKRLLGQLCELLVSWKRERVKAGLAEVVGIARVPAGDPFGPAGLVEGLQAHDGGAGRDDRFVDQRDAARDDDTDRAVLDQAVALEPLDLVQVIGEQLPGCLEEFVVAVEDHDWRGQREVADEVGPVDVVAGVLADLVLDLLLDAHGRVGVAELDTDDRVPRVLQAGGIDAGE